MKLKKCTNQRVVLLNLICGKDRLVTELKSRWSDDNLSQLRTRVHFIGKQNLRVAVAPGHLVAICSFILDRLTFP